jgi:hypothetical protein
MIQGRLTTKCDSGINIRRPQEGLDQPNLAPTR